MRTSGDGDDEGYRGDAGCLGGLPGARDQGERSGRRCEEPEDAALEPQWQLASGGELARRSAPRASLAAAAI